MKLIQINLPELIYWRFKLFLSELLSFPYKCDRGGENCCPAAVQSLYRKHRVKYGCYHREASGITTLLVFFSEFSYSFNLCPLTEALLLSLLLTQLYLLLIPESFTSTIPSSALASQLLGVCVRRKGGQTLKRQLHCALPSNKNASGPNLTFPQSLWISAPAMTPVELGPATVTLLWLWSSRLWTCNCKSLL